MYVDLHENNPFSVKRGLNVSAGSVNPGQPCQT